MTTPKAAPTFRAGDRIAYSVAYLRNTGQRTGPAGARRGTVIHVGEIVSRSYGAFLTVRWDDDPEDRGVAACNVISTARIGIDSALNS